MLCLYIAHMDEMQKTYGLLRDAESNMRGLIESAAADGRYAEVVRLAEIAELVRNAAKRFNPNNEGDVPAAAPSVDAEKQTKKSPRTAAETSKSQSFAKSIGRADLRAFPKFEIDGNRLVKIGWSKRDKTAYEHRASRESVLAVSLRLAEVSAGLIFKMDDILPIELADGTEVPLYQAYMVLAWLRGIGLVEKQGKDGYKWIAGSFDDSTFKAAWESTPRRK